MTDIRTDTETAETTATGAPIEDAAPAAEAAPAPAATRKPALAAGKTTARRTAKGKSAPRGHAKAAKEDGAAGAQSPASPAPASDPVPDVAMIPLADLDLSPLNPRREGQEGDALDRLADNIRALGLIHPLAGLRGQDGRVGVVAGGRRLLAIRAIARREPGAFEAVPVRLAPDEATARAWAVSENAVREPLHPADEIAAFGRMAGDGAAVPQIALAFGTTEAHVHRRLRLAGLPAPVLAALRADRISLGAAAVFTLCGSERRALAVLAEIEGQPITERALRHRLLPEAVGSDDRRAVFVGAAAYRAAGGRITSDLFGGEDVWEDPDLLDALFREALEAKAAATVEEEDWLWAEALPASPYLGYHEVEQRKLARLYPEPGALSPEDEARRAALEEAVEEAFAAEDDAAFDPDAAHELAALEEAAAGAFTPEQKAHAGVILHVGPRGDLLRAEGLVRPGEKAAAIEAGVLPRPAAALGNAGASDMPPSPYSASLTVDLRAVRLAAVQRALLDRPGLVLDLLAFGFAPESGCAPVLGLHPETAPNRPAERSGFEEDPRLHAPEPAWHERRTVADADLPAAFAAFRARPEAERLALLAAGLARTLPQGAMADTVAAMTKADPRAVWRPDEANFLRRMRSAWLDGLMAELLDLAPGDERLADFRAKRKNQKTAILRDLFGGRETTCAVWGVTAEQRARIDAWLPEPMRAAVEDDNCAGAEDEARAGAEEGASDEGGPAEDEPGDAKDGATSTAAPDDTPPATVH